MPGLETGLGNIDKKHEDRDNTNAQIGAAIKEDLGAAASGLLGLELKHLYQDMIEQKYGVLNNSFASIKAQLSNVPGVAERLATIEAGLADKEASKYDAAMKAVKELQEMIQA